MVVTSSYRVRTKDSRKKKRGGLPKGMLIAVEVAVPLLLLALWWVTSANSTNTFFPPLKNILIRAGQQMQTAVFWSDVGSSVGNLLLSFALACLIGIVLGAALG